MQTVFLSLKTVHAVNEVFFFFLPLINDGQQKRRKGFLLIVSLLHAGFLEVAWEPKLVD